MAEASTSSGQAGGQAGGQTESKGKKYATRRVRYDGKLYYPGSEIEFKSDRFTSQQNTEIRKALERSGAVK
jgi:hypothetical protein